MKDYKTAKLLLMRKEWGVWSIAVLILVLFFWGFKLTWAETDEGLKATTTENNKTITAVKTDTPPLIDGQLDDDCWNQAPQVTGFIQKEPHRAKPATQQTIVYLLYDDDNLYIGFVCQEDKVAQIVTTQNKHDSQYLGLGWDDCVEVLLDTYHDGQSAYRFMLNPSGCQLEGRIRDEGVVVDSKWDCLWEVAAVQNDSGWTAEIAIPFSALSFPKKEEQTWGINFVRREKPYQEISSWAYTLDNLFQVSKFGELLGLLGLKKTTRLTLTPTLTGRYEQYTGEEDQYKPSLGLDSKVAVTSNLFFDLTVNPDFAHIEADQDQFNLSYKQMEETYYPEKRPFFLEGLDLFESPIQLLYTRRMNEIDYGGKLTGKVGGLNLGLLDVQTKDTDPDTAANFSAVRLKQDILGSSSLGLLYAGKEKENDQYSRAGGLDCSVALPWTMRLSSQVCKSWNPALEDWAGRIYLGRNTKGFSFWASYEDVGEQFNVEPGYIVETRKDRRGGSVEIIERYWLNNPWLKWAEAWLEYTRTENRAGMLTKELYNGQFEFRAVNGQDLMVIYEQSGELYDGTWFDNDYLIFQWNSNGDEWTGYNIAYGMGKQYGSDMRDLWISAGWVFFDKLSLELNLWRLTWFEQSNWINLLKCEYQISRNAFLRLFFQQNTEFKTTQANCLLGYKYNPATTIYLAYNENRDNFGSTDIIDRIVFVKVSHVLGF